MIQLIVEDYCHSCTDFEPMVEHKTMKANFETINMGTEVTCRYKRKCQRMMTYLYGQVDTEGIIRQCTGGNDNGK